MEEALDDLERAGILSLQQAALLRRLVRREVFSVYWELRVLLYAGILVFTGGLGLLVRQHFDAIGHLALLAAILAACAACFAWCLLRGGGFSRGSVASPNAAYDYVLLLGCLLLGSAAGYLELRYRVLAEHWTWWLLGSGLFYLLSAHYFDSRVVLSLALSTLGAWLGVKTALPDLAGGAPWAGWTRWNSIGFGAGVVALGAAQAAGGWKRHFLPVHLHLGLNVLLAALVSGAGRGAGGAAHLLGALAVAVGAAVYAQRSRRFVFLLYGVLYGYAAVTGFLLSRVPMDGVGYTLYFFATAAAVVVALAAFHARFRSDE